MARGRTISAAERARIARMLARAQQASEREAVAIVRRLYERIKNLPPAEAIAILREAMGPASERIAGVIAEGATGAAAASGRLVAARLGTTWVPAAAALRRRYEDRGGLASMLSPRLHTRSAETLRGLETAIRYSVASGRGALETARRIRDGVGAIPDTQLTRLLDDLAAKARATMAATGDPRALQAFGKAKIDIERYAARLRRTEFGMGAATEQAIGTITEAVRRQKIADARGLVATVKRNNDAAVDRALHWWAYDKQAYQLRSVARTEIARGFTEGFVANASDAPWVVGMQWNVETFADRKRDICDVLGNQNLYGLGAGVYPFDRVPECPAHPNCNCYITEWIDESIGVDDSRPAAPPQRQGATEAWLRSQPASVQREILGASHYEAFRRSEGRIIPAFLRV